MAKTAKPEKPAKPGKAPKLAVTAVSDIPLREVSGLALLGSMLLAVGDRDPVVFRAPLSPQPFRWEALDFGGLALPDGGEQFEAITPIGTDSVLVLQEQPARVLRLRLSTPALEGSLLLEVPTGHSLRDAWLGDRSSRGESLMVVDRGHLIVVKEKDPAAILEFGPSGEAPVGWRRGLLGTPPDPGDRTLTTVATWWLGKSLAKALPDISDATLGPDGCLYLLSDQGSSIARLPCSLDPAGGTVDADELWRIEGSPENAEGLVILEDGTPLVALDTKSPKRNLLHLEPLPLLPSDRSG